MIGIDIIEIERIKSSITRFGDVFLNKIFTPNEIAHCEQHATKYEKYAARFAVKEAVAKVISDGPKHFWKDLEVLTRPNGAPYLVLSDRMKAHFDREIEISMSHCKDYAVGIAILRSPQN